ncbi:MAG: hypothetical protein AUK48_03050 [Oscillatoriales cyanobacterium CG2_30_44_21]|nr:MAG: hypothetical protein AUK48_03050 [Oscillatoriales cyanobacterium CG2_30_44_21]
MKPIILLIPFIGLISLLLPIDTVLASRGQDTCKRSGEVWVKGYTRKDGKYVKSACRTKANSSKKDNWSTINNTNPYTGKKGTKLP